MSGPPREEVLRLITAFHTTTAAIMMEKACREEGLPGRLIPIPRSITASCGMAWCAPPEAREALERMTGARSLAVAGWYYVML